MPIYEYLCTECGRRTESLQRISDPPLTVCPHCGGALRKQVSAPAFQFKGSGWYVTDYAKKGGASATAREKESGGDAKSDTRSETKSEASKPTGGAGGSGESKAPAGGSGTGSGSGGKD